MKALRRVFAIALVILGVYYLLVASNLLPAQITFWHYQPTNKSLALIGILLIVAALFLDDATRTQIKDALS